MATLPHRYPFQLIDVVRAGDQDRALFRLSANAVLAREGAFPAVLAIEILAQAAMVVLERDGGEAGYGYLAGADVELRPVLCERPFAPGDTLAATVARSAGFGSLLKVRGELDRDGETVATANLMLAIPQETKTR